jgi:hypothetical protein
MKNEFRVTRYTASTGIPRSSKNINNKKAKMTHRTSLHTDVETASSEK